MMYSSDQGFYLGEHGWFDKRFMYEESFRTPLVVKWPGVIKPNQRNQDLVQNIDFAETFLDIAVLQFPKICRARASYHFSRARLLKTGEAPCTTTTTSIPAVHSVRRHEGVFDGRFKLIRFYGVDVPNGEEWELFDLKADPGEMTSVYERPEHASRIAGLKAELKRSRNTTRCPKTVVCHCAGCKKNGPRVNAGRLEFTFRQGRAQGRFLFEQEAAEVTETPLLRSLCCLLFQIFSCLIRIGSWQHDVRHFSVPKSVWFVAGESTIMGRARGIPPIARASDDAKEIEA